MSSHFDVVKDWLSIISRKRRSFGDGSVTWTSNGQWEAIVPEGAAYHSRRERRGGIILASQGPFTHQRPIIPSGKATLGELLLYYVTVNFV